MSDTLNKLREQHAKLLLEARAIVNQDGEITKEDEAKVDAMYADADKVAGRIEREQAAIERESRVMAAIGKKAEVNGRSENEELDREHRYTEAFGRYMRFGHEGCTAEQRQVLQGNYTALTDDEIRAQSVSGGSPAGIYGGYTVPEGFSNQLEQSLLAYGGMLEEADVFDTATGNTLPWPTVNDTSNKGAILGENAAISDQDVTFGQTSLGAYLYTSKQILVSWQLMQDSAFNMDSFVASVAGERLGRILNEHFTTGTGSAQPSGIVTGSGLGVTTALQAGVTYDELVNFVHSLDPAYRTNARFMFRDSTLQYLRKLKDGSNRPLFWSDSGSMTNGVPDQLLGHGYKINQDVAAMGAGAKFAVFGNLKKYKIRRVKGYTLVRLNERYAERLQTGFFVWCRFDGKLIDAGTDPVKHIINKSASP
jgi:HK97 family phage major capsid protein